MCNICLMARPRRIDETMVAQAQIVAAQTQDIRELRMAQAILLPALARTTLEQTATLLGVGRATVARLQARFRRRKESPSAQRSRWGGRRRSLMSWEEEEAFLTGWQAQAEHGELVVLTPLRAALNQKLGRRVKPSVVYRLVERHRWRKVAPDTRHPKGDPEVQAEWKKKRFRKSWRPC
jgi:transposase